MPAHPLEKSAVIRFLSGGQRGQVESLKDKTLFVIKTESGGLSIMPPDRNCESQCVAILHRMENTYEVEVTGNDEIWINGEKEATNHLLADGDLVEFGQTGPLTRFRLFPPGTTPAKTLQEALSDSVVNARLSGRTRLGTTGQFVSSFIHDLTTETTARFRLAIVAVISLLIVTVIILLMQNVKFQQSLEQESVRIESIAKILEENSGRQINRSDFETVRSEIEKALSLTTARVKSLEQKPAELEAMLEKVSRSIAFVQGEYSYQDKDSGKFLRYIEAPNGLYLFTLDEIGEKVVIPYSGTAFQVTSDGMLLTNKHLTNPWLMTGSKMPPTNLSLEPVILRTRVIWPSDAMSSNVTAVATSADSDLALLRPDKVSPDSYPLPIQTRLPNPGQEVLLLGYPLGLSGIAARSDSNWSETSEQLKSLDFWSLADTLAQKGLIAPLASRGIVSQTTEEFVAYDAETTMGGSGGPVLSLEGKVLGINTATVGSFGGSNLGVSGKKIAGFLKSLNDAEPSK